MPYNLIVFEKSLGRDVLLSLCTSIIKYSAFLHSIVWSNNYSYQKKSSRNTFSKLSMMFRYMLDLLFFFFFCFHFIILHYTIFMQFIRSYFMCVKQIFILIRRYAKWTTYCYYYRYYYSCAWMHNCTTVNHDLHMCAALYKWLHDSSFCYVYYHH